MSAGQARGLWFKSGILPLLKHACGENDQLLCWPYTPAEVSHREVNLRECTSHMSLPSANKAAHSGFETQRRRHQKSETVVSVAPKMDMCPTKFLKKKSLTNVKISLLEMPEFKRQHLISTLINVFFLYIHWPHYLF